MIPRTRTDLFINTAIRSEFVGVLARAAADAGFAIWAWVLMRNHVHLIGVPDEGDSVARALEPVLDRFGGNHDPDVSGPGPGLWRPRCHAAVIPLRYLWPAVRYIERNPVRARLVDRAEDYPWSSAAYHCGIRGADPLVGPDCPINGAIADWTRWLREPEFDGYLAYLRRKAANRDSPRAGEFVGVFERELDRRIDVERR